MTSPLRPHAALALAAALLAGCADAPPPTAADPSVASAAGVGPHAVGPPLSVAFQSRRDGNAEIYLMNADGSDQTRVTTDLASDVEPDLSPNGRYVAVTSTRSGNADIWLLDLQSGELANLTNTTPRWRWCS